MIVESDDRAKARADHKGLIEDMEKLIACPGWIRIQEYLTSEKDAAFSSMQKAETGDLMMKASGAYVVLSNISSLAARLRSASLTRLNQMTTEEVEAEKAARSLSIDRRKPY